MSDHDLTMAERDEDRAQAAADAIDAAVIAEMAVLRKAMKTPLWGDIPPMFGPGSALPNLLVSPAIDFAGWLSERGAGDITTAYALFDADFRALTIEQYVRERAEMVVGKRGATE